MLDRFFTCLQNKNFTKISVIESIFLFYVSFDKQRVH